MWETWVWILSGSNFSQLRWDVSLNKLLFIPLFNIIIITSWELYSTQRCSFIYTKDCWMAVKAKRPQLSPWVSRLLQKSGLNGLEVKVLTWNVRDMGLNPIWFHFSQLRWEFSMNKLLFAPLFNIKIKDLYKLALAKSKGSFNRMISSFPPSMGWNKIKEWLHYNFGSVATKQDMASMLIDQQQTPTETLQEYVQRFSDLLLNSTSLLLHQAKDLTHITHFMCNLHNEKLQHYMLGKNPTSVQNAIMSAQKKGHRTPHYWRLT